MKKRQTHRKAGIGRAVDSEGDAAGCWSFSVFVFYIPRSEKIGLLSAVELGDTGLANLGMSEVSAGERFQVEVNQEEDYVIYSFFTHWF